jgi:TPR repeat protein
MKTISTSALVTAWAALILSLGSAQLAIAASAPAAADAAGPGEHLTPEERLRRNQVSAAGDIGDSEFRKEQGKGLGGDREAALRVAQMFRSGSNGVPKDERRMLQWLLHASSLNNGAASYQLYQYFLDQRLDREAVFFENRAIEQGYTPPPRLDPRRG